MRLLFINHSASKTGAPIVLLHFLRWLKQNTEVEFDILTLQKGGLLDEFTEVCNNHYYHNGPKKSVVNKAVRVLKRELNLGKRLMFNFPKKQLDTVANNKYDLIYANSIVSVPIASYLKHKSSFTPKVLNHLHELNLTINRYCPDLDVYKKDIDVTIAVSNKVKQNLISQWKFASDKIRVVYAYSEISNRQSKSSKTFVVGASGLVQWRKGTDFFLLVAYYVSKQLPNENIKFQWVGKISNKNRLIYEDDLKKLNLEDKVEFTGFKENPHEFYSKFDVFLMTSKEDPFPLVCVEVGAMGIPIVCFKSATGTEEVLKDVSNSIVPYLDVVAMGENVIKYYNDRELIRTNGDKIKTIFEAFTPENQAPKIFEIINETLANQVI